MAATRRHGVQAPGQATPKCDNAGWQAGVIEGQRNGNQQDCAAAAILRAGQLGIEAIPLADGAWLRRHAGGASVGIVHGAGVLAAAVAGFEAATRDVAALVQRLRAGGVTR